MKKYLFLLILFVSSSLSAQLNDTLVLSFNEFLGYVKKYHPIARQAEIQIGIGQANLMRSRGGFDPKIEVDYERKQFKGVEYYDRFNATFKVPTWYGIELKGTFQQDEGEFLNPDESLPEDGLFSAGVSISVLQGIWINERMATLKRAKYFKEQTLADRDLLVNEILFKASVAYFDWLQAYRNKTVYENFVDNASSRLEGIRRSAEAGDIASIDVVEAEIAFQDRQLSLEQAMVELTNKSLELSNFLWMENNIPIELQPNVIPNVNINKEVDITLEIMGKPLDSFSLENHPKIKSLGFKLAGLEVDKRLKANKLLPRIDIEYNFLTETPGTLNSYDTQQYKGGVNFLFPLFLRKERGDLKLAKFKLNDTQFELDNAEIEIQNKVLAIYNALDSYQVQNSLIQDIVSNYNTLLAAEERKFDFGESSLFLIISRETKLIDSELKQNEVQNKFLAAKAKLFRSLAINPENL
jgi:outer membrane protein TolC